MSADIGAYSPEKARWILDTVEYLKANGYIIKGGQKTPPRTDAPRIYMAVTTSTITGRSGSTAGTGTAVLVSVPGVAGIEDSIEEYPPSGQVDFNIYNIDTAEIAEGAHVPIVREFASGKWFAVPSAVNNPQVYVVQATSSITARSGATPGSGTASVQTSLSGSLVLHSPTIALDVYNAYDVSIADNEYLIVCRDDIDQRWWAVPKGGTVAPESKRIRGNIKDLGSSLTIAFGDATGAGPFTLENIEGIDAAWAGAAEISITNPEKHKLWSDTTCTVRCEYNETSGDWEVYDAQADRVVHGVIRDVCTMKQYNWSGLENWTAGHETPWLTEVFQVGCQLYYATCSDPLGTPFAEINFIDRITWNETTCRLEYEFCDGTTDTVVLPKFVTEVELVPGGCKLEVTKCGEPTVDYTMPYLVSVEVVGSYLQSETACGDTFNIIEFTTCP